MLSGFTGVPPRVAPERGKVLSNEEPPQRHSGWAEAHRSGWLRGYLSGRVAGGSDHTLRFDLRVSIEPRKVRKMRPHEGERSPTRPSPTNASDYRPLASNRTAAIRLCTPSRSKIERVWNFTVLMLMNSRPPISS